MPGSGDERGYSACAASSIPHTPRRGAMNWPFLGLSVGGKTWVLTTGQQSPEKGDHYCANDPRPPDLLLPDRANGKGTFTTGATTR